jgi:hypothetical protein
MNTEDAQKTIDRLTIALTRAAVDAFNNEVRNQNAEPFLIGQGKEFSSRQDWIDKRVETWLQEVETT